MAGFLLKLAGGSAREQAKSFVPLSGRGLRAIVRRKSRTTGREACGHVVSLWRKNENEAHQPDSVLVPEMRPEHDVHGDGIEALVHNVLCSSNSAGQQAPDPLQSLRFDLEMLARIDGADHRKGDGRRRVAPPTTYLVNFAFKLTSAPGRTLSSRTQSV